MVLIGMYRYTMYKVHRILLGITSGSGEGASVPPFHTRKERVVCIKYGGGVAKAIPITLAPPYFIVPTYAERRYTE